MFFVDARSYLMLTCSMLRVAEHMLQFCDEHGLSLLGYSGDRIVCAQRDEYIDTVTGMCRLYLQ
jgi:hypothetical protein